MSYTVFNPYLDEWKNQFSKHRDKEPVRLTKNRQKALKQSEIRHREIEIEQQQDVRNRKWLAAFPEVRR